MTHRKPEPLSDQLRHSLRRQPAYTFPSVEHARMDRQLWAMSDMLRWYHRQRWGLPEPVVN